MEPVREDGKFRGYEIVDATPEAREAMTPQLEIGDIITHANGVEIERPGDYMEAWETFAEADRVHIDFRRDGETDRAVWVIRSDSGD